LRCGDPARRGRAATAARDEHRAVGLGCGARGPQQARAVRPGSHGRGKGRRNLRFGQVSCEEPSPHAGLAAEPRSVPPPSPVPRYPCAAGAAGRARWAGALRRGVPVRGTVEITLSSNRFTDPTAADLNLGFIQQARPDAVRSRSCRLPRRRALSRDSVLRRRHTGTLLPACAPKRHRSQVFMLW